MSIYLGYIICLGTRPALTMSDSARYSASSVFVNNNNDDNCKMRPATADDRRQEWMSIGGQLGIPDAAAPIDSTIKMTQSYGVTMATEELFTKLHEALSLEAKFQPSLYLPQDSQVCGIWCYFYYLKFIVF